MKTPLNQAILQVPQFNRFKPDMNNPRNRPIRRYPLTVSGTLAIAMLLMVGCGGGGTALQEQGAYKQPDVGQAIRLTESAGPAENAADQGERAPGILARADSIFSSTVFGTTDNPLLPAVQATAACSGSNCSFSASILANEFTYGIDLRELSTPASDVEVILTKEGITTIYYGDDEEDEYNARMYGAWMHHGAFAVGTLAGEIAGTSVTVSAGLAGGDLTGSAPIGNAAWKGIMVGAPQGGEDLLQGDAELTWTMADDGGTLAADFTGIVNLDEHAAHSVTSISFDDIPVGRDGIYTLGTAGDRIQGGFYGPGHAETAGVFEKSGIVGAFGARKEE